MGLKTLHRGARTPARRARLMKDVSTEAHDLLQVDAARVLVVYGERDAQIYYEEADEATEHAPASDSHPAPASSRAS